MVRTPQSRRAPLRPGHRAGLGSGNQRSAPDPQTEDLSIFFFLGRGATRVGSQPLPSSTEASQGGFFLQGTQPLPSSTEGIPGDPGFSARGPAAPSPVPGDGARTCTKI